jgi:hypothetical protein
MAGTIISCDLEVDGNGTFFSLCHLSLQDECEVHIRAGSTVMAHGRPLFLPG